MFSRLVSSKIHQLCTQSCKLMSTESSKSMRLAVSTSRGPNGVITGAAVVHKHDGSFVYGEYFDIETGDSQHAELLTLKRGLEILKEKNITGAIVQSSNKQVVEMLNGTVPEEEDMD